VGCGNGVSNAKGGYAQKTDSESSGETKEEKRPPPLNSCWRSKILGDGLFERVKLRETLWERACPTRCVLPKNKDAFSFDDLRPGALS